MEQLVATADIGSSKIVAMVARKQYGQYHIIASETRTLDIEDQTKAFVKRGIITNIPTVAKTVAEMVAKLNQKIEPENLRLEKIYIGYGGQGLHSQMITMKRQIDGNPIAREDLESFLDELKEDQEYENTRTYFQSYFIDGNYDNNPEGKTGNTLQAQYLLLKGYNCKDLGKQIEERASKSIEVKRILVSPEATAYAVLEDNERKEGCALVEIGAGLTTVSIYHNNELKFMTTIPIGGYAITKDISSLKIPFAEAENHKIKHGNANKIQQDNISTDIPTDEDKLQAINNIIAARVKEIAANVNEQIIQSQHAANVRTVIITGGSASLAGLETIFVENTYRPVRIAISRRTFVKQDTEETIDKANSAVIGMFAMVKENCCKEIKKQVDPIQTGPSKKSVVETFKEMFFPDEETLKQSEAAGTLREKEAEKEKKKALEIEKQKQKAKEKAEKEAEKVNQPGFFDSISDFFFNDTTTDGNNNTPKQ